MKNADKKEMYGLLWGQLTPQAYIELHMIRNGGRWKGKKGKYIGEGLAYHYQQFAKVVWPHVQWHKWNELLYKNFADHRFVGILGPAASGKTHTSAIFALTTYYAFSDCITIVCTSTELARLEERVWGEIKAHHKLAKQVCDWLPGHNIDSRQRIVTDDRYENIDGREFKNGIVGVPCRKGNSYVGLSAYVGLHNKYVMLCVDEGCFPAGTLVDTPTGPVPIERLKKGDLVIAASGICAIKNTSIRTVKKLVSITTMDGRKIVCTANHPFFTSNGWIKASDLTQGTYVLSAYEAMSILWGEFQTCRKSENLRKMHVKSTDMRNLQKGVSTEFECSKSKILQSILLLEMEDDSRELQEEILHAGKIKKDSGIKKSNIPEASRNKGRNDKATTGMLQGIPEFYDSRTKAGEKRIIELGHEEVWREAYFKKRKRNWSDKSRKEIAYALSGIEIELSSKDWKNHWQWLSDALQGGCCDTETATCHRGRRRESLNDKKKRTGCEENKIPRGSWVDSVSILESGDFAEYEGDSRGVKVYNLEVEGHPSFSVNGLLVHNSLLPPTFVDAIANMNKNVRFKAIVMGNPKDTTDALGKFCEPSAELNGWDGGIDQTGGTKTWPIRWPDGVCVQLVGSDCPNMDVHEELPVPYPYLITRKAIQTDIQFYGKDSVQFTMMNEGRMPRGQAASRIITRNLCLKFGALEEPVWIDVKRTKIAFADIAYARQGGDRTVFGTLEFGKGLARDGKQVQIISLIGTMLVPVSAQDQESPEDQIANFIKERCEQDGIPPSHFYFDSTGRGSFVSACARIWSPNVNGIEFGGKASERPVSSAISTLCKDYYFNFVTELWWALRLCIEAGQLRNLSNDIMEEACFREWGFVSGNKKIQVEPKDKMKLKSGRSPDLCDAFACGIEGARRRGFVIAKLSNYILQEKEHRWKYDLVARAKELRESGALDYSV